MHFHSRPLVVDATHVFDRVSAGNGGNSTGIGQGLVSDADARTHDAHRVRKVRDGYRVAIAHCEVANGKGAA